MESFALLWNMAKDKLFELGRKCGLLPGASVGSAELHCVVTLSSGITDYGDESAIRPTPVDKLKEALSSSQAFTRHYLVCFNCISFSIESLFQDLVETFH